MLSCRNVFECLFLVCLCLENGFAGLSESLAQSEASAPSETPISKIAFGSCADQNKPCAIWGTIADYRPELMLMLGDNIYADLVDGRLQPATAARIAESYEQLAALPDFARLRAQTKFMGTWDDHDYGNNDAGVEWEHKDEATKLFHDFFGTRPESPRRQQRGVYDARLFGPPGKRLQVIMLDTRYFRSQLEKGAEPLPGFRARPYIAATDANATMLGEAQWKWLAEQLEVPADLRLIATSIQLLSNQHPFEKWGTMPNERDRMFELIRQKAASGVVFLSGDRHLGEISCDPKIVGYPLYDVTASGLNQANQGWRAPEPNLLQVASLHHGNHFGSIEIDWEQTIPTIKLQLRHEDGEIAVQSRLKLSLLKAKPLSLPRPAGVLSPSETLELEIGDETVVQFTVASARMISNSTRLLLNSEVDRQSEENLTVVVETSALAGLYAQANADTFLGKTVRVSGKITLYNLTKQVQVIDAVKLEIVTTDN